MLPPIIPVTTFQQNCSLIWDESTKRGAVVDPGGDLGQVLAAVDHNEVVLEKILLTHARLDHAAGAAELAAIKRITIEGAHRDDKFWIDNLPEAAQRYGSRPARTFEPDRWLEHGDTVTIGGETLEVLHVPGTRLATSSSFIADALFEKSSGNRRP